MDFAKALSALPQLGDSEGKDASTALSVFLVMHVPAQGPAATSMYICALAVLQSLSRPCPSPEMRPFSERWALLGAAHISQPYLQMVLQPRRTMLHRRQPRHVGHPQGGRGCARTTRPVPHHSQAWHTRAAHVTIARTHPLTS